MLSYQHAYHAGNAADVHKHALLASLLSLLTKKERGLSVMETHAGRGLYDLTSGEAQKTNEAAAGVSRLPLSAGTPYEAAITSVRERHGPSAYPGSPLIAQHFLRAQDRHILMELHPAEAPALKAALKNARADLHHRDGYEGVLAVSPPTPRKGLVLIDPSYEVKTEYDAVGSFVSTLITKWPEASVMVWFPHLGAGRHRDLLDALAPLEPAVSEVVFTPPPDRGMTGSGVALINPPFGWEQCVEETLRLGAPIFAPL